LTAIAPVYAEAIAAAPRIQPEREFGQAKPNKTKQKSLDFLGFIRPMGLFNGL